MEAKYFQIENHPFWVLRILGVGEVTAGVRILGVGEVTSGWGLGLGWD
jgi:hypothetical protein